MGASIGQVLRQAAVRQPEHGAVIEVDGSDRRAHTARELDEGARRIAAALAGQGIRPGARVGLMAGNGAAFVQAWFGIVYAGAAVVPIPILSAPPEVAFRLDQAHAAALLVDTPRRPLAEAAATGRPLLEPARIAARGAVPDLLPADLPPDAPAMVLHTSGTSGRPRGACISHASLLIHTATLVQHTLRLGPEDRILGALPLTHSFGARMVMLAGLYAGATLVLVPRFDAVASFRLLYREDITWLPAVPTMFAAWAAVRDPAGPPPRLRWCLSAGAPLPDDTARRAEARLGAEVRQGYGMTEATFSTVNAPPDRRVIGSVGRPVWGVDVRVVDAYGEDVPPGGTGEILMRGHNLMTGYLDDPEGTAEALRGGWMHSGDVGRWDAEGRLEVVDRIKDLILRGGHNVYPSEVEQVLAGHPDVANVVVVGRPDPYYGEEIVAVVQPRPGRSPSPAALVAWARERMSRAAHPREVAVVEALPVGPSGKLVRREVRRRVLAGIYAAERPPRPEPGPATPVRTGREPERP